MFFLLNTLITPFFNKKTLGKNPPKKRTLFVLHPPKTPETATKHQPQRPPPLKIKRRYPEGRSQGQATNSPPRRHSPPKGRAVGKGVVLKERSGRTELGRSNRGTVTQEQPHPHPTGRERARLGKGTVQATPTAPHPTQTRKEGHRRGFRGFPLHTPPPKAFPPSSGPQNGF